MTNYVSSVDNGFNLHSGGNKFAFRPEHPPYCLTSFFFSPSRKMPEQRLNLTTNASFQILSNASLITHPSIQRYTQSALSLLASKQ